MGLLDELTTSPVLGTTCRLRDIYAEISPEEKEALLAAIEKVRTDERPGRTKVYSHTWLADTLSNNGYTISRSTVARHINGDCGCDELGK